MAFISNESLDIPEPWALAIVFGLISAPWTYAFIAQLHIPLWPAFIGSATYFATDTKGITGLTKGAASNVAGILYAALTLYAVNSYLGGNIIALSVVVGIAMFAASLHVEIPVLSFTPGGFFGYATLFSVNAANATAFGLTGLGGETIATIVSMLIGALIGFAADRTSNRL